MSHEKASVRDELPASFADPSAALRDLSAPCTPAQASERLARAARRGNLAGHHAHPTPGEFHIRIFGEPFDRRLVGRIVPGTNPGSCTVRFTLHTLPWLPALFVVISVLTVWPGVWLTQSMLETYYPPAKDWAWFGWAYIVLTALPLPWAGRRMWRKSQRTAAEETALAIQKVEAALGTETGAPAESDRAQSAVA